MKEHNFHDTHDVLLVSKKPVAFKLSFLTWQMLATLWATIRPYRLLQVQVMGSSQVDDGEGVYVCVVSDPLVCSAATLPVIFDEAQKS